MADLRNLELVNAGADMTMEFQVRNINPGENPEVYFRQEVAVLAKKYGLNVTVNFSMNQQSFGVRVQNGNGFLEFPITAETVETVPMSAVIAVDNWLQHSVPVQQVVENAEETMEEVKVKKRIRMGKWGVPSSQMPWKN